MPDLLAQKLSTDAIRRLHKLAPFVRWEPGTISEIAILRQLPCPAQLSATICDRYSAALGVYCTRHEGCDCGETRGMGVFSTNRRHSSTGPVACRLVPRSEGTQTLGLGAV